MRCRDRRADDGEDWRLRDVAGSPAISRSSDDSKKTGGFASPSHDGFALVRQIYTPDIYPRNLSSAPDIDFNRRQGCAVGGGQLPAYSAASVIVVVRGLVKSFLTGGQGLRLLCMNGGSNLRAFENAL